MADHSKPTVTSTYANYTSELDGRLDDLALGLDPATTTPTNVPTNAIRWASASNKWEKWNGSTWGDLSSSYSINVNGTGTFTQANFGDNAKAIFGTGSDLQIYHDGTNSYVSDQGTGNLYIQGSSYIQLQDADGNVFISCVDDGTGGRVQLRNEGSTKLATTSTGIDVTGTVVSDGLTVDGSGLFDASNADVTIRSFNPRLILDDDSVAGANSDKLILQSVAAQTLGDYEFVLNNDQTSSTDRTAIKIAGNGDISFFEDTGTTAKFFWDASAERLGIGTTAPDYKLEIVDGSSRFYYDFTTFGIITNTTGGYGRYLKIWNSDATGDGEAVGLGNLSSALIFGTGFTGATQTPADGERMRITSDGLVGIGTASPAYALSVVKNTTGAHAVDVLNSTTGAGSSRLILRNTSDTSGSGFQIINNAQDGNVNILNYKNSALAFWTNATQRLTLDSAGNLLVGKTTSNISVVGHEFLAIGKAYHTQSGGAPLIVNRLTSDGDIAVFRKDGTTVGSIGSYTGAYLYIGSTGGIDTHITFANGSVRPANADGTLLDNALDLGNISARWDDVYATNGTIQTSDANEKQDIEALSEAEARVAVACKGLLRKFRWKDAVAEKGDEARIHFGIIAQDLQAAFAAEGLNAGRYAMFISSTWTDEETGEERTRLGVRYPELLAFIIAAI